MRYATFRGKCLKSGDLVYGDLVHGVGHKEGRVFILPDKVNLAYVKHCDPLDGVEIDPDTIGQFTGISDNDGKEIYFGDIVVLNDFRFRVVFESGAFCLYHEDIMWGPTWWGTLHTLYNLIDESKGHIVKVIGNIYENPELVVFK